MPEIENANKHNRLQKLRAFCHAAQTGSISRAAERLFLSQPSVSLLIKALEVDLGVVLFDRHGPRIQLTTAGETLLATALPLVEGMDHLPDILAARLGEVESGSLSVAAGESTILYLLADFIKRFNDAYPKIKVQIHNVTGRDGLAMVRAGDVDFAVGSMTEIPEDIAYSPVFRYDPMLITPLNHPLAEKKHLRLEDIGPYGLILPPRHLSTWRIVDLVFQQNAVPYHVVLEAGGWEVVKKFVELGLGISIVTSICLTGKEKLAAKPLNQYFPRRNYGVVMLRNKFITPQAAHFLELMDSGFQRKYQHNYNHPHQAAKANAKNPGQTGDLTNHDNSLP